MEREKSWIPVLAALCLASVCTAQPAWTWETSVVDPGPVVGPSSLAVDDSDHVHIVYVDELSHELKYATNTTGSWTATFVEPSLETYVPSVAVDGNHHLHVVCNAPGGIKYLTNSSGSWTTMDVGVGSYPSIAVDSSGHVHLCYAGLHVWYQTNQSGDWVKEELFPDASPLIFTLLRTSIAVDRGGHAYLRYGSYWDYPGDYYDAYATNISGSWVETSLPLSPLEYLAFDPSIAIDDSDHLHVSYMATHAFLTDYIGLHLGYATNATGRMRSSIVASIGNNWPEWTAMATDNTNAVHVCYSYRGEDSAYRLKYATNAQGTWAVSGPLTDQIEDSPPSIGVDSSGRVTISYTDTDNRLLVISGQPQGLSPTWPGTPAEASAYGQTSMVGSGVFNNLAILLVSGGVIAWLRRKRCRQLISEGSCDTGHRVCP